MWWWTSNLSTFKVSWYPDTIGWQSLGEWLWNIQLWGCVLDTSEIFCFVTSLCLRQDMQWDSIKAHYYNERNTFLKLPTWMKHVHFLLQRKKEAEIWIKDFVRKTITSTTRIRYITFFKDVVDVLQNQILHTKREYIMISAMRTSFSIIQWMKVLAKICARWQTGLFKSNNVNLSWSEMFLFEVQQINGSIQMVVANTRCLWALQHWASIFTCGIVELFWGVK